MIGYASDYFQQQNLRKLKITMKKYRYSDSHFDDNSLTQQLKSFQCSSVIQHQPMYESNQMSWLAPFVNGIEKSQKGRERSPRKVGAASKLIILDEQLYSKPNSLQKDPLPQQKTYQLKRDYRSCQNGGVNSFSKKKERCQVQNISSSMKLTHQERKPLQSQSLNSNYNRLFEAQTRGTPYKTQNATYARRQQSGHTRNIPNQSFDRSLNESVGKIKRNKSQKQQQKQNIYDCYDQKPNRINYNRYVGFNLQPTDQCQKKLYNNEKAYNKKSICYSKRYMDDQDIKLQAMEDRLNNIIRRSAGKIKSSKQTRTGEIGQNKQSGMFEQENRIKERDPVILEFNANTKQAAQMFRQNNLYGNNQNGLKQRRNLNQESSRATSWKQLKPSGSSSSYDKSGVQDSEVTHKRNVTDSTKSKSFSNYQSRNTSVSRQKIIRLLPKVQDIIPQQSSDQMSSNSTRFGPHFRKIFKILDAKATGLLKRGNCAAEKLYQQLKYMLGSVLTKIKYQNYTYDCQKFTTQCQKIACTLDSDEIRQILDKISINIHDLQTKRSYFDGCPLNDTKRSSQNRTPKDSVVVKKYGFERQLQTQFLNTYTQNERQKAHNHYKLFRQPYLEQPSILMSAASQINPIQLKDIQNQFNNELPEISAIQRKSSQNSLSKNPYIGDLNQQQQFDQAKSLRFSNIAPVKFVFSNQKGKQQEAIVRSNTVSKKSQNSQKQRNDKILSLNKRLSEYINKIPKQQAQPYQIKLDFKQLTKNLKT